MLPVNGRAIAGDWIIAQGCTSGQDASAIGLWIGWLMDGWLMEAGLWIAGLPSNASGYAMQHTFLFLASIQKGLHVSFLFTFPTHSKVFKLSS